MLNLVVLSCLLAAAAAEPGALLAVRPLAYSAYSPYFSASYVAPAVATTYAAPLAPAAAPFTYTAGYAHLIKKRSVPLLAPGYLAPGAYLARPGYFTPLATSYSYSAPLVSSTVSYSAPVTHFIKKRSVALAPVATSYANTYVGPTTYAAAPFYNAAYASPSYSAPLTFPAPFYIKK